MMGFSVYKQFLLDLARRSALDGGAASQQEPPRYAMWRNPPRPVPCGLVGCGVCVAAVAEGRGRHRAPR